MVDANKLIKSKERVRKFAEVFTSEREVKSMLDLVKYLSENIDNTFLEPACGTGNFLVEILSRRLDTVYRKNKNKPNNQADIEFSIIKAATSIYGIDISEENIRETRERLLSEIRKFHSEKYSSKDPSEGFWDSAAWVLEKNILVGDFLNKLDEITLIEYGAPKPYYFTRREFQLIDEIQGKDLQVLFSVDKDLKTYKITHYLKLCH